MSQSQSNDLGSQPKSFLQSYLIKQNIRTIQMDGTTYYVAKDVARSFGYADASLRNAINLHCVNRKRVHIKYKSAPIPTTVINLTDLCMFALRCRLKPSEDLRYWILNKVIERFQSQSA
ncbi:MAG: BRO family protein [Pseudomonadota bacterium]